MKMLIAVIAVVLLLAAPGLANPASENCVVTYTVPAEFSIELAPEVELILSKTGFEGTYELDPNVGIICDGNVMMSMDVDVLDLGGNQLQYFLAMDGESLIGISGDVAFDAGVYSGLLRVDISETTPLLGGLNVVATITISMTDV